jgi:integrase/recombinase XerD
MAQGAFTTNTLRAWKADWKVFSESCRTYRVESLPASPKTVRDFVFECLSRGKKPATIRRYVSTIGRAHRASGVLDPTASEEVKLALKEMGRKAPACQKQARGLTWGEIELFLSVAPRNLRDIRDRALVAVAYDTMCRREVLVSLRVGILRRRDCDRMSQRTKSVRRVGLARLTRRCRASAGARTARPTENTRGVF